MPRGRSHEIAEPALPDDELVATPVDFEAAGDADAIDAPELRSIERLLATLEQEPPDPFTLPRRKRDADAEPHSSGALQAWALQPLPNVPSGEARSGFLAWLFLGLGLMALACGSVMLGWSIATQREDLWSLGIPLALGGQAAIIFGLISIVEGASHRQKLVAASLEDHRQRLTMMQNLALAEPRSTRRAA
jgi:hypothetical protein